MMIEDGLAREPEEAAGLPLEDRLGQAALAALMGDPYEVGLRIALDDGVAAALPTVARELAVLDRAVGVVRSGLAGLAPAAAALPVPVVGASGAEAAPETRRLGANPAPEMPASRGVAPRAPMETVLRGAERAAAEMLPTATPRAPAAEASVPPARVEWQRTDWPALTSVPGVVAAAPLPAPLAGVAAPALPELPAAAPEAGAAEEGWTGAQRPAAAPPALPPALLLPPDFAEPAAPAQAADARDQEAERDEERVLEGRLEIDGALLGRFVAEHLAREAGRPASGMTGFDPLVSPQWAGALQG
jgi:hypothetical protein